MRIGPSVLVQMLLLVASTASLPATELQVANLFSDGAVIQRGMTVPVWGTGTPGAQIRVTFAGQMQKTTVDDDGRWRVILAELTASSVPQTLTVSDADNALQIRDMLVGEVWLCSGQSNMAMRVDLARDAEDEKATSDLPLIRVHTVAYAPARKPLTQSSGQWVKAGPDTAGQFSAIAFFFGRELHRKLKVPVGLIVAARGGSDITTWTSRTAQQDTQELNELLKSWEQKVKAWTPEIEAAAMATYEKEFPKWKAAVQAAAKAGQRRPPRPAAAHAGPSCRTSPSPCHVVQWHDSSVDSLRHSGCHLVSGRIQCLHRRTKRALRKTTAIVDSGLARALGAGSFRAGELPIRLGTIAIHFRPAGGLGSHPGIHAARFVPSQHRHGGNP